MRPHLVVVFLLVSFVATFASSAAAFCRKTTAGGADEGYDPVERGRCPETDRALPLYWREGCIATRVVVEPALEETGRLTLARARSIVQHASSAWTSAQCAGRDGIARPVAMHIADVATGPCDGDVRRVNEVIFTATPVAEDGLLAVTDITFDAVSGAIASARMTVLDIHAGADAASEEEADGELERVVRHEMGHLLGLGHSQDANAVMYAGYDPKLGHGLTDDDVAGICDAYAPDRPIGAGCQATSATRDRAGAIGLAVASALVLAARRRRRWRPWRVAGLTAILVGAVALSSVTRARADERRVAVRAHRPHASKKKAPVSPARRKAPKRRKPAAAARGGARAPGVLSAEDAALVEHEEPTLVASLGPVPAPPSDEPPAALAPPPVEERARKEARDEPPRASPDPPRTSDLFVGARYRAFLLPKALVAPVATMNQDLLFHSVGLELEIHHERFSLVPAVTFADLSTPGMLVGDASGDLASSFSYVKSDLKAVAASVELLWAAPLSRSVSLELGVELGIGATFGSFVNTWAYETPDGPLAHDGRRFAPCQSVNDGFGCRPQDHASPTPVRVGDYQERSFVDGGKAPTILPWVTLPVVGVRASLGSSLAARFGVGASFTGLWAGVSIGAAAAKAERR